MVTVTLPNEVVLLLLEHGAFVDALDHKGRTPMHYASLLGQEAAVRALLMYNADVMIKTPDGYTALDLASDINIKNMLEEAEANVLDMHLAFAMGLHNRLGSEATMFALHPELVRMVVEQCRS